MARTRTIKRPRKGKKSSGFLPDSVQAFVARRLVDSFALFFLAAGAFLFSVLLTYNSSDPSWNTAVEEGQGIMNWGGETGAWMSDILLQTFPLANWG